MILAELMHWESGPAMSQQIFVQRFSGNNQVRISLTNPLYLIFTPSTSPIQAGRLVQRTTHISSASIRLPSIPDC
jgi:hypothetical protein